MRAITALSNMTSTPSTGMLTSWAKCLALSGGNLGAALDIAERSGAPDRVQAVIKAVMGGAGVGDESLSGVIDATILTTTFLPLLRNRSVFYRLADGGFVRLPFDQRVSFTTANASGFIVGEGAAVPLSGVEVDGLLLDRLKACGLIVMTNELLRSAGSAGEALLTAELQRAVAATVDEKFFDLVVDVNTPTSVSGVTGDMDQAVMDIRWLLDQVRPTEESQLVFAMSPDVARRATCIVGLGGWLFPNMTPTGGDIRGVPAMISDGLSEGTLMLIDGRGIAGAAENIVIESSNEATIEMETTPSGSSVTPAPTTMVSLYQTNSAAIMAKAYFGAKRLRDNAVAMVGSIGWGGESGS